MLGKITWNRAGVTLPLPFLRRRGNAAPVYALVLRIGVPGEGGAWQKYLAWQNRIGWLGRKEIDSLAEKN